MSPLISAVGVRKGFGKGSQRIEVLKGVDLEVDPGEFVLNSHGYDAITSGLSSRTSTSSVPSTSVTMSACLRDWQG